MSRSSRVLLMVFAGLTLVSSAVYAQGTITGVVEDASGGLLPGVTVEVASPALIEKVRTVVSDSEGRYNIVDLRPGTYVVTFTLGGFSTFKREGIELTSGFTATVNADMKVGALEETVTVTWTDGRSVYEFSEVEPNARIDASRFARPVPPPGR